MTTGQVADWLSDWVSDSDSVLIKVFLLSVIGFIIDSLVVLPVNWLCSHSRPSYKPSPRVAQHGWMSTGVIHHQCLWEWTWLYLRQFLAWPFSVLVYHAAISSTVKTFGRSYLFANTSKTQFLNSSSAKTLQSSFFSSSIRPLYYKHYFISTLKSSVSTMDTNSIDRMLAWLCIFICAWIDTY